MRGHLACRTPSAGLSPSGRSLFSIGFPPSGLTAYQQNSTRDLVEGQKYTRDLPLCRLSDELSASCRILGSSFLTQILLFFPSCCYHHPLCLPAFGVFSIHALPRSRLSHVAPRPNITPLALSSKQTSHFLHGILCCSTHLYC